MQRIIQNTLLLSALNLSIGCDSLTTGHPGVVSRTVFCDQITEIKTALDDCFSQYCYNPNNSGDMDLNQDTTSLDSAILDYSVDQNVPDETDCNTSFEQVNNICESWIETYQDCIRSANFSSDMFPVQTQSLDMTN
mgnify:FL=1